MLVAQIERRHEEGLAGDGEELVWALGGVGVEQGLLIGVDPLACSS